MFFTNLFDELQFRFSIYHDHDIGHITIHQIRLTIEARTAAVTAFN